MPFATYVDVEARLGRPLTPLEQASATAALSEAESAVQIYTGQTFNNGTYTDRFVSHSGVVGLSQKPVKTLTGFRVAGVVQDVSSLTLFGNTVQYVPTGVNVEIDYTFGYDMIPAAIKGIVVRAALRAMSNPTGVAQFSIGAYSETRSSDPNEASSVFGLTDLEILNRYRSIQPRTVFVGSNRITRNPNDYFQGPGY